MAKPIGVLLKEAGIITEEMIVYALKVQEATGERLGDTLLRIGFVTDREVATILAQQTELDFIDPKEIVPDPKILSLIPFNFAQKSNFLPVGIHKKKLVVAVSDPFNTRAIGNIERFAGFPVRLAIAPQTILTQRIEHLYYQIDHPISDEVEKICNDAQNGRAFSAERLYELLLSTAIEEGSSDIHVSPTEFASLASYRIDGVLQLRYSMPPVTHSRIVAAFKVAAGMDIADQNRPQDGRMSFEFLREKFDLRVSTIPTAHGENLVIRVLVSGSSMIPVESLGFTERQIKDLVRMTNAPYGMILATGPTGSGKSTTLYGLLRKVNSMEKNVMTVEDPIEYQMPLIHQVAVNPKAGITFASAIKSFLRQDPDVILIGEIRDEETSLLSTRAALTGHLVLSTLHTNDAPGAVARLRDLGLGDFMLSSTLMGVVSQRLIRLLCSHCKKEFVYSDSVKIRIGLKGANHFQHDGCKRCRTTGYSGRQVIGELLEVNDQVRELIATGNGPHEIKRQAVNSGMMTLSQSGVQLLENGKTDVSEYDRVVK
jgi:type II secretory ATPase GspE/PulE/Tfp pilus assembly ATPase PilB-like protein